jgi:hypothetical protein
MQRAYSAGKFALELGVERVGFLATVEGGEPVASVDTTTVAGDPVERKRLGAVSYEPMRISFGSGMGEPLYKWIAAWLKGKNEPKDGAIVMANYNFNEQSRLEFKQARITEVCFPALDAAARERALFTVTLQPERTAIDRSHEGASVAGSGLRADKQLLVSNFRLKLDKLPTARVNKVDALIVRWPDPTQELKVPNLIVTVAEAEAKDYFDWFEDSVRDLSAARDERGGTIEFLTSGLNGVLFRLSLFNLGVFRVHRERSESGAEVIARVSAQMYCERLEFEAIASKEAPAPAAAPPAPTAFPSNGPLEATQIAQRLKASVQSTKAGSSASPKRDQGAALGALWATETATLGELEQIAALEPRDWSAIRLADQHSLIGLLARKGVLPAGADGALDLQRDSFVEGIVAGAAQILRGAAPHLEQ